MSLLFIINLVLTLINRLLNENVFYISFNYICVYRKYYQVLSSINA